MPSAAVILLQDGKPVAEFRIEGSRPFVMGRSSAAEVHVRDPKLSRQHCEIHATADGYFIRDLGSRNGTFVNGARITEARIGNGDRIQIGLTRFLFRCEGPAEEAVSDTHLADAEGPRRCAACGTIVPLHEVARARQTAEHIYCSACLAAVPLIGKVIAGYEVVQCIGRGSMGTVFKAEQLSMRRHVALKILHKELSNQPEAVERFLREARAGGQFSHPNIVRIYDMNQADGHCFIAMEYVPGGDAGSLLDREGPLPVPRVLDIAIQAATALAHAHSKGVVHRDVKPSNLLLANDGLVKLADLGLAKSLQAAGLSSLTGSGVTVGTFAYIPPEQIDAAAHVDARADIYSLGATCHHLLTGVPPFRGGTITELARIIRTQRPSSVCVYRDDVPAQLDLLITRAMAKDPARRFGTADEMLAALQAIKA